MIRILGAALVLAIVTASALADDVEKEIKALELEIARAVVASDGEFIERVWDDDFFYTGVRGEVKQRDQVVSELKSGKLRFELLQFDDVRVRVYGTTAVATGLATTKGRGPQGEISGKFRYTRVYVKRGEQWRLVAFQGTPWVELPPDAAATPKK
jgi:ketosteroid isomerase-like protein